MRNRDVFVSRHFVEVDVAGEGADDFAGVDSASAWGGGTSNDVGCRHDGLRKVCTY